MRLLHVRDRAARVAALAVGRLPADRAAVRIGHRGRARLQQVEARAIRARVLRDDALVGRVVVLVVAVAVARARAVGHRDRLGLGVVGAAVIRVPHPAEHLRVGHDHALAGLVDAVARRIRRGADRRHGVALRILDERAHLHAVLLLRLGLRGTATRGVLGNRTGAQDEQGTKNQRTPHGASSCTRLTGRGSGASSWRSREFA